MVKIQTDYVIERVYSVTWEIDIIYSTIWCCPVPYFRGFGPSGESVSETVQEYLFGSSLFKVSLTEHPISNQMWFYVHPCSLQDIVSVVDLELQQKLVYSIVLDVLKVT
jgi:hypothetical protein